MSNPNKNNNESHDKPFIESCLSRLEHMSRATSMFKSLQQGKPNNHQDDKNNMVLRQLLSTEVELLKGSICRCRSQDWSLIYVYYQKTVTNNEEVTKNSVSRAILNQVSDTTFSGVVVLGLVLDTNTIKNNITIDNGVGGIRVPPYGIHHNTMIQNCILEPYCRVYDNALLESTHVYPRACVLNCGTISRSTSTTTNKNEGPDFASSLIIEVGPETGGSRKVNTFPEMTLVDVCRRSPSLHHPPYTTTSSWYTPTLQASIQKTSTKCPLNIVSSNSILSSTPSVQDVYLSEYCYIHAASTITNTTLLPYAFITNNSIVTNTILQWNSHIQNNAHVSNTLLMEYAHVDSHGICHSSILGPNSALSAGETHCTVLGPHTNSHHQSLLISTIWLTGRGNVGYGSNIGSNHTGRSADQECVCGEGVFWGLSCVIKFPVNLSKSVYSIVASGVTLLPQKMDMPFSLIMNGSGDNGGGNEVMPGWVLRNSAYTIARAESKFLKRNKAKRHAWYTNWKIYREGIVDLCWIARDALTSCDDNKKSQYNGDKDIKGLGKCVLSEKNRMDGIIAYTDFIQRYALRGLLHRLEYCYEKSAGVGGRNLIQMLQTNQEFLSISNTQSYKAQNQRHRSSVVAPPILPCDEPSYNNQNAEWNHQYQILLKEFPSLLLPPSPSFTVGVLQTLLTKLIKLERIFSTQVYFSKHKDDFRGNKVIPGYQDVHVAAENDAVVVAVKMETKRVDMLVKEWIGANTHGSGGETDGASLQSRL